jgi:DNA topoisomerase-6 subunit A
VSEVIKKIEETAREVRQTAKQGKKPTMRFPIRTLANVRYDPKIGFFQLGRKHKERALTYTTVRTFAQSMRMLALCKNLVESDEIIHKREAYYQAYNWGECRFNEQPESDTIMDDIEAMYLVNREQLGFIPDVHGGSVIGELIVTDKNPATGKTIDLDMTKMGTSGWTIPSRVEELKFKTKAKFILVVETTAIYQRLVHHAFWKERNCILVAMSGVPTRACRRFVRRMADENKIPVYVFTDGDPYGYMNIYRTLKVGSGNAAHINEFFCVPQARYLGVTPWDIKKYKLPTHPLKDEDRKRAHDALKSDPFVKSHKKWQEALETMLKLGERVEQQAFAARGLNFVMETYLPEKLAHPEEFLP